MKLKFSPFPELNTKRLYLRQLLVRDVHDVFEFRSNPELLDYTDGKLDEYVEDSLRYINNINKGIARKKWLHFAVLYKETKKVIGTINLWNFDKSEKKAEVGYSLNPLYQRRGLMSEALEVVIKYAFDQMHVERLEIWTDRRNIASIKLAEKFGFEFLKEDVEKGYYTNRTFNINIYVLRREKYEHSIL